MLSNAVILKSLGVEDEKINKIINAWNSTTRTVITKRGMDLGKGCGVDYESYLDKAVEAFMEGGDLSFEEFAEKPSGIRPRYLPYKAKYMLEDGTFGDQMVVSEINALSAPVIQPNIQNNILGQDLILSFEENPEWAKAITDIQIGENYFGEFRNKIPRDRLGIEDDKLTVKPEDLKLGNNVISINAKGYRTVVLNQNIVKAKIQGKVQDEYVINKEVHISELTPEFLNDISEIKLNGRALLSNEWATDVIEHKLKMESRLFPKVGQYKIRIETAGSFETLNFNLEVGVVPTVPVDTDNKKLPTLKARSTKLKDDIEVSFDGNSDWEKSVYKVQRIDKFLSFYRELEFEVSSGKLLLKQGNAFTSNGKYTIRVFAIGYEPVDVDVNIYYSHPQLTMQNVPRVGSDFELGMQRDSFNYDWVEKINAVYIDGQPLTEWKTYRRNIDRLAILKDAVTEPGVHLILVKSIGYEDALKRVTYAKSDGGMIEVPTSKEMEVPSDVLVKTKEIEAGKSLSISSSKTGYQHKVNGVYLDGEKLELGKNYSINLEEILIKEISGEGQRTIRITADGYKDKEFVIKVNKADIIIPPVVEYEMPPVVKPEVPEVVEAPEAPEVPASTTLEVPIGIEMHKTEVDLGTEAKVSNLTFEYKNSIKEVYLNGNKLNKDTEYTISLMGSVIVSEKLITEVGENKIVIKAEGYREKEFAFTVKGEDKEEPEVVIPEALEVIEVPTVPTVPVLTLLEVPTRIEMEKPEVDLGTEAKVFNLTFEYKSSINEIYLNGIKLNKDIDYIINIMGSIIIEGKLITQVGENNIVIRSEGYEEKEFIFTVK